MTNVVLIMADDMRYDHLPYLANVRTLLQEPGRTFTGARCNVALCQPNRIGLFTGQLSRDHGELGIGYRGSAFEDHDNGVARWMSDTGYRCGLMGKYINYWDSSFIRGIDAPKGWKTWRQLTSAKSAAEWDVHEEIGSFTIRDVYQTDYLAEQAAMFMDGKDPWFCYLAPQNPHAPFSPHPRDLHAWPHERFREVPLPDASTKPPWVQALPELTLDQWAALQQGFRGRLRELSAVDRLVGDVVEHLRKAGTLDDTVIIFSSDNGVHQGEQRRVGEGTKAGPYDVGLRVPLVVRGPGFGPGPHIDVPIYSMQDLTATLVDLAGAEPGFPHQAGLSLRRIVADPAAHASRTLLHEIGIEGYDTTGDGITTGPRHELGYLKLFRYPSVRSKLPGPYTYELYDLADDPDELVNLADRPDHRSVRDTLERQLLDLLAG